LVLVKRYLLRIFQSAKFDQVQESFTIRSFRPASLGTDEDFRQHDGPNIRS
jgi:hypothetical protein